MPRYDLRRALHHPLRFLRYWWLHLALASVIWAMAAAWTFPVFQQVRGHAGLPIALGALGAVVLASALFSFERRLQAVTGAALVTAGLARTAFPAELLIVADAKPRHRLDGTIDEVLVYDRALTAVEIAEHHNAKTGG